MPYHSHDVGPIQALIDELEFNAEIAQRTDDDVIGALFLVAQFERAIREGLFSLLPDSVDQSDLGSVCDSMRANMYLGKKYVDHAGGLVGPHGTMLTRLTKGNRLCATRFRLPARPC